MAERRLPNDEDFPSNSNTKPKAEPQEKTEALKLRGAAKPKRSLWKEVKGEFIAEDVDSVGGYILHDILFPALRDLVSDIGHGFIDAAMGGKSPRYRSRRRDRDDSYISYNRMYDDRDRRRRRDDDRYDRPRRIRDLDEIVFDYREDAEDCLEALISYLERYDEVPVSYLYDKLGWTIPGAFTDDDWGWTNLSSARIRPYRGGFRLELPRVKPL